MYKLDLIKLDPLTHILLVVVIGLQVYSALLRPPNIHDAIERAGAACRAAAVDRERLEATLAACNGQR